MLEWGIKILLAAYVFLDLPPMPPPSFLPHHLSQTSQLQGWFLARPRQCFQPFHVHSSFKACSSGFHACRTPMRGTSQPLTDQTLMQSWSWWFAREACLLSTCCPTATSYLLPSGVPGLAVPLMLMRLWGSRRISITAPTSKNTFVLLGWWHVNAGFELFVRTLKRTRGTGWPISLINRPWGHSCILLCLFLVTASCPHPDKTTRWEVHLGHIFCDCARNEKCWAESWKRGGGHEGCTDTSHNCLLTAENPFTSQELSLDKATLDFFSLKMNFRRIFLIKCLLLLFPSVKCEFSLLFGGLMLLKLYFKPFTSWWDVTDKKLVPLTQWVKTFGLLLFLFDLIFSQRGGQDLSFLFQL